MFCPDVSGLNLCHSNLFPDTVRVFEFRFSPSLIGGLNMNILVTLNFANLGYRIYEMGH